MPVSRTEAALAALYDALAAKANEAAAAIPAPLRNEDLFARFEATGAGGALKRYLNLWDGEHAILDELLGADLETPADDGDDTGAFEIEHIARLEWACADGSGAEREAAFWTGMRAIHDCLRPTGAAGDHVFLGGAVDHAGIVGISFSGLATDGMPGLKACEVSIRLTFTSPRPF